MIIKEARSFEEFEIAVFLFKEYASQIGVDLSFQKFDKELGEIRKQYSSLVVERRHQHSLAMVGILVVFYELDTIAILWAGIIKERGLTTFEEPGKIERNGSECESMRKA